MSRSTRPPKRNTGFYSELHVLSLPFIEFLKSVIQLVPLSSTLNCFIAPCRCPSLLNPAVNATFRLGTLINSSVMSAFPAGRNSFCSQVILYLCVLAASASGASGTTWNSIPEAGLSPLETLFSYLLPSPGDELAAQVASAQAALLYLAKRRLPAQRADFNVQHL